MSAGGLAQVNLLPPEVRAARGVKVVRRLLLLGLVLVAVVLVGGYVLSLLELGAAQEELAAAEADTLRLQEDQRKYAEVPQVLLALDTAKSARMLGMSTEVEWKPYLDAITAVLPPDVSIDTVSMTMSTPMLAPSLPATPLQSQSLGQISFTGRTTTLPDTAAWVDALNSIPGLGDAWVSAATLSSDADLTFYSVTSTIQIRPQALSGRFLPDEEAD
jgi:Tfp pilus assembly protein PilN